MKIDLHVHTTRYSACSRMTPEELVAEARAAGLEAVLITEHNEVWDRDDLRSLSGVGLLVLGGTEVTCPEGDCLVIAPDLDDLPKGLSMEEAAQEAHRRGGLVFVAHPFRTTLDRTRRHLRNPLDGLEQESCNNFGRLEREAAQAVAQEGRLRLIAASDAHRADMVGCFYVELERAVSDVAGLVAELRRGAYRCRRNDQRFYRFTDVREGAWRVQVRTEVAGGTEGLEEIKRTTGVSSDVIRSVLGESKRPDTPG